MDQLNQQNFQYGSICDSAATGEGSSRRSRYFLFLNYLTSPTWNFQYSSNLSQRKAWHRWPIVSVIFSGSFQNCHVLIMLAVRCNPAFLSCISVMALYHFSRIQLRWLYTLIFATFLGIFENGEIEFYNLCYHTFISNYTLFTRF